MLKSILSLSLLTVAVQAADLRLTIDGAASYALKHNPTLAAARARIDEARGRLVHSGRLTNPELEVELSRNPRAPEGSWGVALVQKFPLTARLRLEKSISQAELSAAEAEVRNEERKLAGDVRLLTVKILALREQRSLRDTQIAHSRELGTFLDKRVATGEASTIEAAQVQLETQQLEAEQLQLDTSRAQLIGELRPLLGIASGVEVTGDLPSPLARRAPAAMEPSRRADYLAAQANLRAAEQGVAFAQAQKWDDLGVGFTLEHERSEDAPEGYRRDTFLGLKFSLPLPIWNQNEGKVQEAKAIAVRKQKEVEAIATGIRAEALAARAEMATQEKILTKLQADLLPAAVKIEEQFRSSYGTGQVTLPEALRARTKRLELEQQRLDALRDYHLARVRLQTATTPMQSLSASKQSK